MLRWSPVLIALAITAPAAAQQVAPREAVTTVAKTIEQRYFDPAVGKRVADELRADAATGRFDAMQPDEVARALTVRLSAVDRHFSVHWAPPRAAGPAGSPPPPGYGEEEGDRRTGYGFRSVRLLPGNIGYIELDHFAPIDFDNPQWPSLIAADAALALVSHSDAVIIDLRGNGGGDPGMIGYLASAFVGMDADVYNVFHAREGTNSEKPPFGYRGKRLTMPVYVLTGRRTGSAAESLAYTLQAARRATVVGEPSAGTANPGQDFNLPGGYTVFVSFATPINPVTHGNWERTGVQPEKPVVASGALPAAEILALEASSTTIPAAERPDALRVLEARRAAQRGARPAQLSAYAVAFDGIAVAEQDGALVARRERRPDIALGWIGGDVFYSVADPAVRYRFARDGAGSIARLTIDWIDGRQASYSRAR